MDIMIREAVMDDFPAVLALFAELDAYHAALFPTIFQSYEGEARAFEWFAASLLDAGQAYFVAEGKDGLVGFVNVAETAVPDFPLFRPTTYALVKNLFVQPAQRGTGVAQALMGVVTGWARERQLTSVQLHVYAGNVAAEQFYEKLGFAPLKHLLIQPLTDN